MLGGATCTKIRILQAATREDYGEPEAHSQTNRLLRQPQSHRPAELRR